MSQSILSAVIEYLLAQNSLTNLVGRRIRKQKAQPNETLPYLVVLQRSGVTEYVTTGISGQRDRVEIHIHADTTASQDLVTDQVKAALSGYRGALGELWCEGSFQDDEAALEEDLAVLGETLPDFSKRIDFRIHWVELEEGS